MRIVPFQPEHIRLMNVQEFQREASRETARAGDAWTALVGDVPMGCGGLLELWEGRAMAWSMLSQDCGPYMLHIVRAIRKKLDRETFRRIEMYVRTDFGPGCRLARLLGFEIEGKASKFLDDGRDAFIYARIRNG